MKFLLFLFSPFIILAQTLYSDTLVIKNGNSFPCYVTDINESGVSLIYANNFPEFTVLQNVSRVYMSELGVVYQSKNGFIINKDSIENNLQQRRLKLEYEQKKNELADDFKTKYQSAEKLHDDNNSWQRWSFGVLYVPYYSGKLYHYNTSNSYPYLPQLYSTTFNETNLEGQFSYGVMDKLRLTLDIGYTSTFNETRDEQHRRPVDQGSGSENNNGYINSKDLKLFTFTVGVKYYFTNFLDEKVSAFVTGGIGRQLAFSTSKDEVLFQVPQPDVINQNNLDEFLEDINSPWNLNFGFGAEYFFNESLSLFSSMRFYYSRFSGKYDSRTINQFETRTSSTEHTSSAFVTRFGLGLNFYF